MYNFFVIILFLILIAIIPYIFILWSFAIIVWLVTTPFGWFIIGVYILLCLKHL